MNLKYDVYKALSAILPEHMIKQIAGSPKLRPLRDRFLRPTGKPEIVSEVVNWEGFSFYFAAPYRIFAKVQSNGIENRICRLARSVLSTGATAIDVGSNYGFISTVMAKSTQPDGHVICIEVDPDICELLTKTMARNGLSRNSHVIARRAGSEDSDQFVTVDHIVSEHRLNNVGFMKVDVDGEDFSVLLGAEQTLKKCHPVVVVEMEENQEEIFNFLINIGYVFFTDLSNKPVSSGIWPNNLIVATQSVTILERGFFKAT